jgi:hypothetical protein
LSEIIFINEIVSVIYAAFPTDNYHTERVALDLLDRLLASFLEYRDLLPQQSVRLLQPQQ